MDKHFFFWSSLRNIFSSIGVKRLEDIASPCRTPLAVGYSKVSSYILTAVLAVVSIGQGYNTEFTNHLGG